VLSPKVLYLGELVPHLHPNYPPAEPHLVPRIKENANRMKSISLGGKYLLAAAFALAITLYGGMAKADGVQNGHHDNANWSSDKDSGGLKHDFKSFQDQDHNNGWNLHKPKGKGSDGDDGWKPGKPGRGKDGDGGCGHGKPPKTVPEPSSLALLSVGVVGLAGFLRRKARNLGIGQA
jgi:PEP-CTERM motif